MSRDGNGTYVLPEGNPVVSGTIIESEWANTTMSNIAAALTGSIAADGQTQPVNNLPMNGFNHTNVADPALRNQYLSLGMLQDGRATRVNLTSSAVNDIVGTMAGWSTGNPTSYVAGMIVGWFQPGNNTGLVTLNISGRGARSVVGSDENELAENDLVAGNYYIAYYDGIKFILISQTSSELASESAQESITGWSRPTNGVFPQCSIEPGGAGIRVPAGSGLIIAPGTPTAGSVTQVSWDEQVVALQYLTTAWSTALLMTSAGTVLQVPTQVAPEILRDNIYLCTVEHTGGLATGLSNRPAILGDDGYLMRDTNYLLGNRLVSGGKVTAVSATTIAVSQGVVFQAGLNANNVDNPNYYTLAASASPVTFNPVYVAVGGANTAQTATTTVPAFYNPGASSAANVAIPANSAVVHRLYWLAGRYYLVLGQTAFTNIAGSTANVANAVANASSQLDLERSKYQLPALLAGAVLISEIIVGTTVTLTTPDTFGFVSPSSTQYLFGSAQSLADAPNNANTYGRYQNTWVPVITGTSPSLINNATITGGSPQLIENMNADGGQAGVLVKKNGFNWFGMLVDDTSNTTLFRSYDKTTGTLIATTTVDINTGCWDFTAGSTIGGVSVGNVVGPATATDGAVALYDGTTGKLLKNGQVPGTSYTYNIQTTPTDETADRVLKTGSFGLGTRGALTVPDGTTAQRPVSPAPGDIRFNSTISAEEYWDGISWVSLAAATPGLLQGLQYKTNASAPLGGYGCSIAPGFATAIDNRTVGTTTVTYYKYAGVWEEGAGTTGTPKGSRAAGAVLNAGSWARLFAIMKPDGTMDFGIDSSPTAANLIGAGTAPYAAGYRTYRRIGYLRISANINGGFNLIGDATAGGWRDTALETATTSTGMQTIVCNAAAACPPNCRAVVQMLAPAAGSTIYYSTYNLNPTIPSGTTSYDFIDGGSATLEVPMSATTTFEVWVGPTVSTTGTVTWRVAEYLDDLTIA